MDVFYIIFIIVNFSFLLFTTVLVIYHKTTKKSNFRFIRHILWFYYISTTILNMLIEIVSQQISESWIILFYYGIVTFISVFSFTTVWLYIDLHRSRTSRSKKKHFKNGSSVWIKIKKNNRVFTKIKIKRIKNKNQKKYVKSNNLWKLFFYFLKLLIAFSFFLQLFFL